MHVDPCLSLSTPSCKNIPNTTNSFFNDMLQSCGDGNPNRGSALSEKKNINTSVLTTNINYTTN